MSIINLENSAQIEQLVSGSNVKVLIFWASWCTPYKRIMPMLEEVAEENKDVDFIKIDADKFSDISEKLNFEPVTTIPVIVFMKDGKERATLSGTQLKDYVTLIIEKVKAGETFGRE